MTIIDKAVNWAIGIANDNSHGYDQIGRWGVDYDCSSLVIQAYEEAGLKVKEAGASYTENMRSAFKKCGFQDIKYTKGMLLLKGDVLLNEKKHTCMFIGNGQIVQASCNEKGGIYNGKDGDQTGREIAVGKFYEFSKGWDYVLRYREDKEIETVTIEMPVLQLGSKCYEVGTLQIILNGKNFKGENGKSLTVDCDFGKNVRFAVHNVQVEMQKKGIIQNIDDICGSKTWNYLLKG